MNLALFDFDGTISTEDSFLLFARSLSLPRYLQGCLLLSPRIIAFLTGLYPNHALKEDFLVYFLKQKTMADMRLLAERFCSTSVPVILRPKAIERMRWHQDRGDHVSVVSACPRLILEPWCRRSAAELIATELEIDPESRITGRIAGRNCWGKEKVRRIRARYAVSDYDRIFAYGDSKGDLPMLEMAAPESRFFKPFR